MDDFVTYALLSASVFFIVLAFGLLARYRQVSQKITVSTDMGRDLWQALDQRLKKQDERILDMMGRFEVAQSHVMERPAPSVPVVAPASPRVQRETVAVEEPQLAITQRKVAASLDPTQVTVIKLLGGKPRSSVEIKELAGKSREHTARLMKSLFDRGLVTRDVSQRPFVYQLTDAGRRYLSAN